MSALEYEENIKDMCCFVFFKNIIIWLYVIVVVLYFCAPYQVSSSFICKNMFPLNKQRIFIEWKDVYSMERVVISSPASVASTIV